MSVASCQSGTNWEDGTHMLGNDLCQSSAIPIARLI